MGLPTVGGLILTPLLLSSQAGYLNPRPLRGRRAVTSGHVLAFPTRPACYPRCFLKKSAVRCSDDLIAGAPRKPCPSP